MSPTLILIMGVPCAGKSTFAMELIKYLAVVYLDNNFLADSVSESSRRSPEYRRMRPMVYEMLYRTTKENLLVGNSVLLDAPHVKQMQEAEWRSQISRMCRESDSQLLTIRCICSSDVLRERMRRRGLARDRWKLENWSEFLREEPPDVKIPWPHLDVDTTRPLEETVSEALRYIKRVGLEP